jgi:hypothetical protein
MRCTPTVPRAPSAAIRAARTVAKEGEVRRSQLANDRAARSPAHERPPGLVATLALEPDLLFGDLTQEFDDRTKVGRPGRRRD